MLKGALLRRALLPVFGTLWIVIWAASLSSQAALRDDFVELQRTRCNGTCPAYSVRVYADGRVNWDGKYAVRVRGTASARISTKLAQELLENLRAGGFWDLRDEYRRRFEDTPGAVVILHIGKREKRVIDNGTAPTWLQLLENKIDTVANTQRWIRSDSKKTSHRLLKE
jgi:hypothetical protein